MTLRELITELMRLVDTLYAVEHESKVMILVGDNVIYEVESPLFDVYKAALELGYKTAIKDNVVVITTSNPVEKMREFKGI